MAEHGLIPKRFLFGLVYTGLMCALMLVNIVPFEFWPRRFPGPDLMVAITFVWLLRRPNQVPAPLVAAVFLIADILLMRPLGLWAALMVISVEFLRSRRINIKERAFLAEWALAAGTLFATTVAYTVIVSIALFEWGPMPVDKAAIQAFSTVLAYPLVAATAKYVLGVTVLTAKDFHSSGEKE